MMKSIISLCVLVFCFGGVSANDSTAIKYDSSSIELRQFDSAEIEDHKTDSDFDYGVRPAAELSFWQRLKLWLSKWLSKLFYFGTETPFGKIVVYVLCGVAIVYVIMKLLKIQSRKLFYKESNKGLDYDLHHEDIHELDFEKLIEEALQEQNYRLAIRLIYLHTLKYLSDQHLIDWQPGKTNYEYVDELKDRSLKTNFNDLSFYFDYAWYGDFEVNQGLFQKANGIFDLLKKNLTVEKRS